MKKSSINQGTAKNSQLTQFEINQNLNKTFVGFNMNTIGNNTSM
jgi:hypothetical protein